MLVRTTLPLPQASRASCTACVVKLRAVSGPPRAAIAPSARHMRCTTTTSVCGVASSAWNLPLRASRDQVSAAGGFNFQTMGALPAPVAHAPHGP